MKIWVLREDLQSEQQGKEVYFRMATDIGPMTTYDIDKAMKFPDKTAAMNNPALRHAFSFFKPHEIESDVICGKCGANVESYLDGSTCTAALDDRCEGFEVYESIAT